MRNRCYRDIKKGNKISKLFQCCCIQGDENVPPVIYWSFGSSVYQYDPLLNKCRERASLKFKRAKFNMISHGNRCYVIGGVLEIEEYNTKKDSWKKVACLPGDAYPKNPSCVAYNELIYVFSAILDKEDEIKPNATAVYVFDPSTNIVKKLVEIPLSFNQMKTCVVGSFIYIASDEKHFLRFCPSQGSYFLLPEQMQECKDFGMFTKERSIVLAGGYFRDIKYKNIRVFCTDSGHWDTLSETLPDNMPIYGACKLKIPNSAGTIVPFYETNIFEKR
ncbi:kelch-like protein 24/35 [Mytilus galloprovincialis]|uniref:Kelch-like protein 24/35 n=1 Tax=Mytilus galloprovincialis TaxID=29158 RepID=A0A8B6FF61_MYTGA|nr:kelch-like protein 24/35 [Mytilus galloprovincialis]